MNENDIKLKIDEVKLIFFNFQMTTTAGGRRASVRTRLKAEDVSTWVASNPVRHLTVIYFEGFISESHELDRTGSSA